MSLTEDDIYRSSTQFRLWSFTPDALASLRATTNETAAARVVAAITRHRESQSQDATENVSPISTLSPGEELQILTHYARQLIFWSTSLFHFPYAVTATAAMYYKRFYLSNSPMTYHPKSIFPTCLFLATKTEHHYSDLGAFVDTVKNSKSKIKPTKEEVLAPEYLLIQGLRFTLDVKHPRRGMDAVWMELDAIAKGEGQGVVPGPEVDSKELQERMTELDAPKDAAGRDLSTPASRAGTAHAKAKETLIGAALLTDCYFLFTPSQIMFAALMLVDEPLVRFYFEVKMAINGGPEAEVRRSKIVKTIRECADMLGSFQAGSDPGLPASREDLIKVDKKLYECLNPEKRDLVKINAALKAGEGGENTNGKSTDDEMVENSKNKRKAKEDDDVFGPPLKKHESPAKKAG